MNDKIAYRRGLKRGEDTHIDQEKKKRKKKINTHACCTNGTHTV
jgi:hypothetical protein